MAKTFLFTDDMNPLVHLPEGAESTIVTLTDTRESFSFEIDLGDDNFKKLLTALRKFRENGRDVQVGKGKAASRDSESDGPAIRAWAQAHPELLPEGVKVPGDKGALSAAVKAAYDAHNGNTVTLEDPADPRHESASE